MQKKENAKIREEIEFYERIIQEKQDDEDEEIDVDKIETASHAYIGLGNPGGFANASKMSRGLSSGVRKGNNQS
jgi:hypothetical protein